MSRPVDPWTLRPDPWVPKVAASPTNRGRPRAAAPPQEVPLLFTASAKAALTMVENALGQPYMGLEAAATHLVKSRSGGSAKPVVNKAVKMLRALHCAFNLERHFTEHGTQAWMWKLSSLLEEAMTVPESAPALSPTAPPFVPAPPVVQPAALDVERINRKLDMLAAKVQAETSSLNDRLPSMVDAHLHQVLTEKLAHYPSMQNVTDLLRTVLADTLPDVVPRAVMSAQRDVLDRIDALEAKLSSDPYRMEDCSSDSAECMPEVAPLVPPPPAALPPARPGADRRIGTDSDSYVLDFCPSGCCVKVVEFPAVPGEFQEFVRRDISMCFLHGPPFSSDECLGKLTNEFGLIPDSMHVQIMKFIDTILPIAEVNRQGVLLSRQQGIQLCGYDDGYGYDDEEENDEEVGG